MANGKKASKDQALMFGGILFASAVVGFLGFNAWDGGVVSLIGNNDLTAAWQDDALEGYSNMEKDMSWPARPTGDTKTGDPFNDTKKNQSRLTNGFNTSNVHNPNNQNLQLGTDTLSGGPNKGCVVNTGGLKYPKTASMPMELEVFGTLDMRCAGGVVKGWAYNTVYKKPLPVHFFVVKPTPQNAQGYGCILNFYNRELGSMCDMVYLGNTMADKAYTPLPTAPSTPATERSVPIATQLAWAKNHGFTFTVPAKYLTGEYVLAAYVPNMLGDHRYTEQALKDMILKSRPNPKQREAMAFFSAIWGSGMTLPKAK